MTNRLATDKNRRCLPLDEWPQRDRQAWAVAISNGDILDPCGSAAHWAPATQRGIRSSYGRFLTWLKSENLLDTLISPADRITPKLVAQYITHLGALNAASTVFERIRSLYTALSAMAPDTDWAWMKPIICHLSFKKGSIKNKRIQVVSSDDLFALGIELMNVADGPFESTVFRQAALYRDGLIIALLAARPLRRSNFTNIEIGRHLVLGNNIYWIRFPASEIKNHIPFDAPVPTALVSYLERYLAHYRQILLTRCKPDADNIRFTHNALWVSSRGTPLFQEAIYDRIVAHTKAKFRHAINPHLFRHCAATSIATEDPDRAYITMRLLGHSSLATSEKTYNHAQSLIATGKLQGLVLALRSPASDASITGRDRTNFIPNTYAV